MVEARLHAELPAALEWADVVLISDYGKGVCTPSLLRAIIDAGRSAGVKVLVDPIRSSDYGRYHGAHCMTPNRLEAQLATGMSITTPEDALAVGRRLVEALGMEAVLVTLDRDGMALVRADGRAELLPTRPRQVYDITGAGDMVLAVVGLCVACGADYDEAAAARKHRGRARGREVRRRAPGSCGSSSRPGRPSSSRRLKVPRPETPARRGPPPPPGGADGGLHQRLLRPAASGSCAAASRRGESGRFPGRRLKLRRQRAALERGKPPHQPGRGPCRGFERAQSCRCRHDL